MDYSHVSCSYITYHQHHLLSIYTNTLNTNLQVTDLLKEQLYLQSELAYEAATPSSGRSSRASSPARFNQTLESCSPSPQRASVYRATLNLMPTLPPRPGMEAPRDVSPKRMESNLTPTSLEVSRDEDEMSLDGHGSGTAEDCSPTEWRSRSRGNGDLQHLIQEVRDPSTEMEVIKLWVNFHSSRYSSSSIVAPMNSAVGKIWIKIIFIAGCYRDTCKDNRKSRLFIT